MKIRFQADADLSVPIVKGVLRRELAIDFQTARDGGVLGLDDPLVLGIAADQGRMLVSHDVTSMPGHFARFIETRTSPGVVLVLQRMPYHQAIERLWRLWATSEAERWTNVIFYLPH